MFGGLWWFRIRYLPMVVRLDAALLMMKYGVDKIGDKWAARRLRSLRSCVGQRGAAPCVSQRRYRSYWTPSSTLSWPGVSRPPVCSGTVLQTRGRRDKTGDDGLRCDSNRPETAITPGWEEVGSLARMRRRRYRRADPWHDGRSRSTAWRSSPRPYGPFDFTYAGPGLFGYPHCEPQGDCSPHLTYTTGIVRPQITVRFPRAIPARP